MDFPRMAAAGYHAAFAVVGGRQSGRNLSFCPAMHNLNGDGYILRWTSKVNSVIYFKP
jgi:hypothetical protein